MTAGVAKPTVFNRLHTHQRDSYMQKRMPVAAAAIQLLLNFVDDPTRNAHRDALRKIMNDPRGGTA